MFYRPTGTSRLIPSQGLLVTDEEIRRLVEFISAESDGGAHSVAAK
jgi:hypothetical protein